MDVGVLGLGIMKYLGLHRIGWGGGNRKGRGSLAGRKAVGDGGRGEGGGGGGGGRKCFVVEEVGGEGEGKGAAAVYECLRGLVVSEGERGKCD